MVVQSKVIVALDIESQQELENFISQLSPSLCRLKIGKTLFTRLGPEWVKSLQHQGFEIFLDLKFHDIPQQVAGACREATRLGVWMVNVHALGGLAMLKAARQAVDECETKNKPLLIGVTLLTSLSATDLALLGMHEPLENIVIRLATLCHEAGLDGVVCSAQEALAIKAALGSDFLCVTPGIRLQGDAYQDQKRVLTPSDALLAGSDYLVIGRSITHAASPMDTLYKVNQSISVL